MLAGALSEAIFNCKTLFEFNAFIFCVLFFLKGFLSVLYVLLVLKHGLFVGISFSFM